jgi:hypothetical protein
VLTVELFNTIEILPLLLTTSFDFLLLAGNVEVVFELLNRASDSAALRF